jgi:large subunit ribosomal protein L21
MYAVIETGGKQYRVAPGASIEIETLTGDVGSEVEFNRVLALVDGDSVKTGEGIGSALVKATITEHGRTQKTLVFKFKRKKQYKRTIGHRQNYTRITVNEIVA